MAEYNFCLSDNEYKEFITALFIQNFVLVPLAYYKSPDYLTLSNQNEFDNFYKSDLSNRDFFANQFFILHKEYIDDALYLSPIQMDQGIFYVISIVGKGSQAIEFDLGENISEGRALRLLPTMLGYQKVFWNKELTISRKPSEALKKSYKEIK